GIEVDHLQYGQSAQGNPAPEPGLSNWVVYLDENHNGMRDPGERFTTTDQGGNFTFADVPPGTYTVAEEGQPGWTQTAPPGGTTTVTVHVVPSIGNTVGETVRGIEFGNQQTGAGNRAPAPTSTPPSEAPVGGLYRYAAAVSNPDGVPLTFDLPVKP